MCQISGLTTSRSSTWHLTRCTSCSFSPAVKPAWACASRRASSTDSSLEFRWCTTSGRYSNHRVEKPRSASPVRMFIYWTAPWLRLPHKMRLPRALGVARSQYMTTWPITSYCVARVCKTENIFLVFSTYIIGQIPGTVRATSLRIDCTSTGPRWSITPHIAPEQPEGATRKPLTGRAGLLEPGSQTPTHHQHFWNCG